MPVDRISGLRIDCDRYAKFGSGGQKRGDEFRRDQPLSVVFDDDAVRARKHSPDSLDKFFREVRRNRTTLFSINSYHLLMAGHNPGLGDRLVLGPSKAKGHSDTVFAECLFQQRTVSVVAIEATQFNRSPERSNVARHIGRAPGIPRFTLHLHDRDRSLGRNPGNAAPDKPVQHHISNHEESAVGKTCEKILGIQAGFRHDGKARPGIGRLQTCQLFPPPSTHHRQRPERRRNSLTTRSRPAGRVRK